MFGIKLNGLLGLVGCEMNSRQAAFPQFLLNFYYLY